MKLTKQRLKQIISEELRDPTVGATRHGSYRAQWESMNPEWDKADKIKSALVYLADDLVNSERDDAAQLAKAIVHSLHLAVRALEARLNEKFAAVEPKDDLTQGDREL
jgi:hypothetical protein